MPVQSNEEIAEQHASNIGETAKYSWHDPLTALDDKSTISAKELCLMPEGEEENMKAMYADEQSVTQIVIDNMKIEQTHLSTIYEAFKNTDEYLSGLLSNL